jgi:TonB family protein
MSIRRISCALVLLVAGFIASAHASPADDTLARAKGLYASAAYDEALAVLDQLQTAAPADEATSIAEYRVFCLLALDRHDEARKNIDRILHDNPLYVPSADQASPRIQSVFRDVRRQSLPKIVMERYAAAKAAFERKDSSAAQQFDDVLMLLDDPDLRGTPTLSDLRQVASAFRDLTKALATTGPPPAEAASGQPPAVAQERVPDIIYTSEDADVIPPVAKSQKMPTWRPSPNEAVQQFTGVLRLLIDSTGTITSASMPDSTSTQYDQLLLRAARDWKFSPARKNGVPVRYLLLIEVRLQPTK